MSDKNGFKGLLYSPEVLGGLSVLTQGLAGKTPDVVMPSLIQGVQTAGAFSKMQDEEEKRLLIKEFEKDVPADQKSLFKLDPKLWLSNFYKGGTFKAETFTKGKEAISVDVSTKDGKIQARQLLKDGWINSPISVQKSGVNPKGTDTRLTKEILDAKGLAEPLSVMKNQFEPAFLTYKGEVSDKFSQFREKMGLGKDDNLQKFVARRNQWLAANNQFFNNYRKAITGVAAGEKEIGYLKQSIPSDDDSPSVYMAKLEQQIRFNNALIARNEKAIQAGIVPETDADGKPAGKYKEFLQKEENKIQVSEEEVLKMATAYKNAGFNEKITQFKLIKDFGEKTVGSYFNLIK